MSTTFIFTQVLIAAAVVMVGALIKKDKKLSAPLAGYGAGLVTIGVLFYLGKFGFTATTIAIMLSGYTILLSCSIGALSNNYYWLIGLLIPLIFFSKIFVRLTEGTHALALINTPDYIACGACGPTVDSGTHLFLMVLIPLLAGLIAFWVKGAVAENRRSIAA